MNNQKKPVCLHFHIYKNAGSTIDFALKRNFSADAVIMDTGKPRGILSFDTVLHYCKKHHPAVKSFSSHQIRFPIPENPEIVFLPMVFIREPIDRAFSIYRFDKRRDDIKDDKGVDMAKKLSASEYFKWNMTQEDHFVMKNFQVRFLATKPPRVHAEPKDVETVFERLKECTIVGVVDRMDESLLLAEEKLGSFFGKIDFSYVKQNVSKERQVSLNDRLENIRMEIGNNIFSDLKNVNDLDYQLYTRANEILDENLKSLKNMEEKLLDFKKRSKEK